MYEPYLKSIPVIIAIGVLGGVVNLQSRERWGVWGRELCHPEERG